MKIMKIIITKIIKYNMWTRKTSGEVVNCYIYHPQLLKDWAMVEHIRKNAMYEKTKDEMPSLHP
jgi:hypothetical protein